MLANAQKTTTMKKKPGENKIRKNLGIDQQLLKRQNLLNGQNGNRENNNLNPTNDTLQLFLNFFGHMLQFPILMLLSSLS